jgi:transcriptional regulator with XRE-family HTH domain
LASFARDLRTRLRLDDSAHPKTSVREIARRAHWSRTMVSDFTSGKRLPRQDQLQDLLAAVDPPPGRAEPDWFARRASVESQISASSSESPAAVEDEPGMSRAPRTNRVIRSGAMLAIGLALGVFGTLSWQAIADHHSPSESGPDGGSTGASGVAAGAVAAKVAYTDGLGVNTYREPTNESDKRGALPEGTSVMVSCLDLHGQAINDYVGTTYMTRTVWARLANGSWVPDFYLTTDKSWPVDGPPRPPLVEC